jgi:PTS system fructose-specific IIA component/PTS system nitrogen regulatory IIA component
VATIALSTSGVDFASLDGEDVFILFLLVSPPDRPGDHLRALENISRHLRNDSFCKFLRQSSTANAVMELLEEADSNQLS